MASDKDIENWLNDHQNTLEAPQPQAKMGDADIEAWLNDPKESSVPQTVMQSAQQVLSPLIGDTSQYGKPVSSNTGNPVKDALLKLAQPFEGAVGPSRLSASISQPGQVAGQNVTDSLNALAQNLNGGNAPTKLVKGVNSVLGTADALSLDPQNYAMDGLAKGSVDAGAALVAKAGDEAANLGSAVSGVKLQDIQRLFENPLDVIAALSKKDAGGLLGAAKQAAGVTREEEFLISKAGDRAVGGARTVAEELRPAFEADPSKVTMGELIALRRAAGKLATEAKGSEKALWAPVMDAVSSEIETRSSKVADAISQYANASTKQAFMRLVPRSATGKPDFFRAIAAIGTGLATSPASMGLATLAAKAGQTALAPIAMAATSPVPRNAGLAVLRNYILKQRQNQP